MKIDHNLFVPNKISYVKGNKPDVACILCAILEGNPEVVGLLVYQTDLFAITLNLYPYNSGHVMIYPKRHITDPREYTREEVLELNDLQNITLDILQNLYDPCGLNVGYNIGSSSGQSIQHLHMHIVPRYPTEVGFIDIIGGAKIIVEDPSVSQVRISEAFKEHFAKKK